MDIQAQDRAHRIGQTKPVLIFRLVSAHTIETEIMQRATEKRKLEALVIAKGIVYFLYDDDEEGGISYRIFICQGNSKCLGRTRREESKRR